MKENLSSRVQKAVRKGDINALERLYLGYPENEMVKFEYANAIKEINIEFARTLFFQLLNSSYKSKSLIELGVIERKLHNYDDAKRLFNNFLNLNGENRKSSDFIRVNLELVQIETEISKLDKAYDVFKGLVGTLYEYEAYLGLGIVECKRGNYDEAREFLKKTLGSMHHYEGLYWLGMVEKKEKRYLQAMFYFNELLSTSFKEEAKKQMEEIRNEQRDEYIEFKKGRK